MAGITDRPYDIKLNGHGYLLAREGQLGANGRAWAVESVGSAIGQQSATEATYSPMAPIIELPMVWDSWHRGFGDEEKLGEGRYYYSQNVDCRFEGKAFPALQVNTLALPGGTAAGHVLKFVELQNQLFAFNDRYAFQIYAAQNSIVIHKDFGSDAAITDACAFNNELIVARGYQDDAYSFSLGNVWIWGRSRWGGTAVWGHERNAPEWAVMLGIKLGYLAPFRDRLNATTSDSEVRWCSQGPQIGGNWTAAYRIGDPGTSITSLGELGEMLYIGKRDGLYALGSDGYAVQITPELRTPAHIENCKNMRAWHGSLWVPHQRGFFAYRSLGNSGFTVTSCNLGARAGQSSPVRGVVTAIAGDDRWLYIALWTGSDTYILAGREVRADEDAYAPLVWHPLWHLDERVYSLHIGATGLMPRLWIGAGQGIKYVDLPYGTDNPLQDDSCTYGSTGTLYFSRHSCNAPSIRKLFKSVEIIADHLQNSQYIEVWYRPDNLRTWRPLGFVNGQNRATRSPSHILSCGSEGVLARRIELRLDIHASSSSHPPILRSVILRAAERPQTRDVMTAVIRCADNLPTRTGGIFPDKGADILARLKALSTAGKAVELEDIVGYKRPVLVLPGVSESETKQEGTRAREVLATIRMTPFQAEETPPLSGVWVWGTSKWGEVADGGSGDKWLDPEQ